MRYLVAITLCVSFLSSAAGAPVWTVPGWYQVADTIVGPFVWAGPFESKAACEQVLPANEEDADYVCEYLTERPAWDD